MLMYCPCTYRILNEQLEKFRKECSELKVQNAKLASQVSRTTQNITLSQLFLGSVHKYQ